MNKLERLQELSKAATPGPWEVHRTDVGDEFACMVPSRIDGVGATVVADDGGMCPYSEGWKAETLEANAQLIVLSRNHIDALIAIAEAAKEYLMACDNLHDTDSGSKAEWIAGDWADEKEKALRAALAKLEAAHED